MVNHPRAVQSTYSPPFPAYPSALSDPEWVMLAPFREDPIDAETAYKSGLMDFQTRSKTEKQKSL